MKTTRSFKKLATLHSATCFLNSFLREWKVYSVRTSSTFGKHVVLCLDDTQSLFFPIKKYSILGRHQYTGDFYLKRHDRLKKIVFEDLVELLCHFLLNVFKTDSAQMEIFKQRVFSSVGNIQHALQFRSKIKDNSHVFNLSFQDTEQALIVGHNFHPTPKSRDEFSLEDSQNYAPEFGAQFHLEWCMVNASILHQHAAQSFQTPHWTLELFKDDFKQTPATQNFLKQGMIPVPMHPWQFRILCKNSTLAEYIKNGSLVYLGSSQTHWTGTSSLRTVYRDHAPYMLKFSMNLKLTNSIRKLLGREVVRGLQLCDVLHTPSGKHFQEEHPYFKIITEPAYFGINDNEGNLIDETIVICRENPFYGHNATNQFMLASLTQDDPFGKQNLLQKIIQKIAREELSKISNKKTVFAQCIKKWFDNYLNVVLRPLFMAYANYGFILEAHQQNLILELEDGYPVRAYFRDCQDSGYSELGFATFSPDVPLITRHNGNVPGELIATRFFTYQVIINSTFNIISTLADSKYITETELLDELRLFLNDIRSSGVKDPACLNYILDSTHLSYKGNFVCALKSIHDNTTNDPLGIYTSIPNPLFKNAIKKNPSDFCYERYSPVLNKKIKLRTLDIQKDFEQFYIWNHQPRIADVWELNQSHQELRDYLETGMHDPHQILTILEIDDEPIGYFEIYWASQDRLAQHYDSEPFDRGFHFFIGEQHFLGVKNTKEILQTLMYFLYLDDDRTKRIIVEPRYDNERFIKYTKIIPGWTFVKEFEFPEKRAALFISQREKFLQESVL